MTSFLTPVILTFLDFDLIQALTLEYHSQFFDSMMPLFLCNVTNIDCKFNFFQFLSISFKFFQFLSISFKFFQFLSNSFNFFQFLSISFNFFQFLSISFKFFQILSISFNFFHIRSCSKPSTAQPCTLQFKLSCPCTRLVVPLVLSLTLVMVSVTQSQSMKVTPFLMPSFVSTWPVVT